MAASLRFLHRSAAARCWLLLALSPSRPLPTREARRAITRCRSSASRSFRRISRTSTGSIPTRPRAARCGWRSSGSTFDSLNPFSVQGDAGRGRGLIYDTLMAQSPDEESTEYGLVAEWVSYPPDYSSATFGLRPEARFHDGKPITPEDVIFSLEALKKAHPQLRALLQERRQGREDRRARGDLHLRHGPATASCRKSSDSSVCCRSTTGKARAPTASRATFEVDARGAARLRTLQDQVILDGQQHRLRARQGLLGQGSAGLGGQWNFDELRFQYFRDRVAGIRGVQERRRSTSGARTPRALGTRSTTSMRSRRASSRRKPFPPPASPACRRSPSTCGARSSRIRACATHSISPSTSRT